MQNRAVVEYRVLPRHAHRVGRDGWLTEGFDTEDLKEAKALLDALS